MNYLELAHITQRLAFDLMDARLEQICDGDNRLQLTFRPYGEDDDSRRRIFLIIDFAPTHLDIYPTTHPRKAPAQPQAFTMLLRKYIGNHCLTGLHIADNDRIVTFSFGFDVSTYYELIVELTGRSPKIFFVETESRSILGRIGNDETRSVHEIYTPPEAHPLHDETDRFENAEDIYKSLDGEFAARDERERVETLKTQALKRLNKSLGRAEKLIASLSKDLFKAEQAEQERSEADLLNAYAWQLKQGMLTAELPDFETGAPMKIALDPALSIRENIEKRYAHSKRMIRSREQITQRLDQTKERKVILEALIDVVTKAKDASPILEQATAIDEVCAPDEKNRPATNNSGKGKKSAPKVTVHRAYKIFKSADGTQIFVGKSAKDNDDLTFHHSKGNDYWLHVSGLPGSHVVVKSAEPSQETLIDAALLAMHYSKLAKSESAEVHVTQVKYVRKPKGFPDGKVEIRGEKCLIAQASEKRLSRLMQTES